MAEFGRGSSLLESLNENRAELFKLSKPIQILCYGSNDFKCSKLKFEFSEERIKKLPFWISLQYAQDLDVLERFAVPVYTQEITQLIVEGIDVLLILIGLNNTFSQPMFDLLTSIPNILKLEEVDKQCFWERAVIAFDVNDHPNPEDLINESMEGNIGIKQMVEKVGRRYTYLSTVEPDALVDGLVEQCQNLTTKHSGKGLIKGKGQRKTSASSRYGSVLTSMGRKVSWLSIDWKYILLVSALLLVCGWCPHSIQCYRPVVLNLCWLADPFFNLFNFRKILRPLNCIRFKTFWRFLSGKKIRNLMVLSTSSIKITSFT